MNYSRVVKPLYSASVCKNEGVSLHVLNDYFFGSICDKNYQNKLINSIPTNSWKI